MNRSRNRKDKKVNVNLYIRIFVLIITLIGVYGIIKAPASDKDILERELAENEEALTSEPEATLSEPSKDKAGEGTLSQTEESLTPFPEGSPAEKNDKTDKNISVIGDSVFLGASPSFLEMYKDAVVDAKVSRRVSQGLDIAKELDKNGQLGSTVIISLGTNGNFNESTGQELIDYLGADRTIYWINAYGKSLDTQDDANRIIKKLTDKNDNVHLIPWAKEAKKHPDWFYQDGIHLNKEGQKGFAEFVSSAIEGEE